MGFAGTCLQKPRRPAVERVRKEMVGPFDITLGPRGAASGRRGSYECYTLTALRRILKIVYGECQGDKSVRPAGVKLIFAWDAPHVLDNGRC